MPANVGDIGSQRQQILDLIQQTGGFFDTDPQAQQLQGFFDTQNAQDLLGQFQGRASGADSPFSQNVISSLLAGNSDSAAGRVASEQGQINRQFSRQGLGGSGGQLQANFASQRAASRAQRQGRRDITSRAALGNFQARERAQGQVQGFLNQQLQAQQFLTQQRFGAQSQATGREVDFRSRLQDISSQNQQNQQQQNFLNRANVLAGQANQTGQIGRGGYRDPGGAAQIQANRNTASTQLNALIASGGGFF